jgi:hypothetical protein
MTYSLWRTGGRTVHYELVSPSGTTLDRRTLFIKPDWHSSWGIFPARERECGVWKVRVIDENGNVIVVKPFWQEDF